MSHLPFKSDEIGYWSELKLEIIEKYGSAYTKAFTRAKNLKKFYIDAFSGAGVHVAKGTGERIEGSPARALKVNPPFDGYYFIDLDADKTGYLQSLCRDRSDVFVFTADANQILIDEILPKIHFAKYTRALCLLDPYKLDLDWSVILQAGQSRAVDMFLNFPIMDINRSVVWKEPERAPQASVDRLNRFWGDESWKQVAYQPSQQRSLFEEKLEKQSNKEIVAAFRQRLRAVAGFQHVPEPLPMRNSTNAVVYYLFLASQKPVAGKIITEIFAKYR